MRDQRGLPWLEDLLRDVRHGVKALAREPAVACLAVLTLALGIGANTAIFSIVNAVLLQPLPFEQPERLVSKNVAMPAGEFLVIRDHARTLASAALYNDGAGFNLSASGHADRLAGAYVSDTFFETLGAQALLGRTLRSGENEPGSGHVVVLSHGLWRQRFGADPGIVGREILVDSQPKTVAGVMPEDFSFPSSKTRLWVAYTFNPRSSVDLWGSRAPSGRLVARMTPGADGIVRGGSNARSFVELPPRCQTSATTVNVSESLPRWFHVILQRGLHEGDRRGCDGQGRRIMP